MSAICGIFSLDGSSVNPDTLQGFNHSLNDYGGDAANIWWHGRIGLGQQMSHLTLESIAEILPYYNESRQIGITADIRLFNRKVTARPLSEVKLAA